MSNRLMDFIKHSFVLFCCLLSFPIGAFACSCSPYSSSPKKAVREFLDIHNEHKIAVFLGKVNSIHNGGEDRIITFAVKRSWHTQIESEFDVETGWGGGDCGYPFEKGETYLVFASKYRDHGWVTSICSPTTSEPEPFLKVLGEGKKPIHKPKSNFSKGFDFTPYNVAGITLIVGSILLTYFLTLRDERRKRRKLPPTA